MNNVSRASDIKGAAFGDPLCVDGDNIHDVTILPPDLIDFLCVMDGFAFNGIEIFSWEPESVEENFWVLQSFNEFNNSLKNGYKEIPDSILVIGRGDEDLYLYDENDKLYKIVDRIDLMVYEDFSAFEDMFFHLLAERGEPGINKY